MQTRSYQSSKKNYPSRIADPDRGFEAMAEAKTAEARQ